MIQSRLQPLNIKREREDYPQVNYIDDKGVQWIELNRGCPYRCEYCYADPNFKEFPIPEIKSNTVQIIGEGVLSDSRTPFLFEKLGNKRVNNKVIYYAFSQGINKKNLDPRLMDILSIGRFGRINNKGNWFKGIRISWDLGLEEEGEVYEAILSLQDHGYINKNIMVFILVNYKVSLEVCLYKLKKLKEWGVMVDDCTWNCTKTLFIPQYWRYREYYKFRKMCRDHNIAWSKGE